MLPLPRVVSAVQASNKGSQGTAGSMQYAFADLMPARSVISTSSGTIVPNSQQTLSITDTLPRLKEKLVEEDKILKFDYHLFFKLVKGAFEAVAEDLEGLLPPGLEPDSLADGKYATLVNCILWDNARAEGEMAEFLDPIRGNKLRIATYAVQKSIGLDTRSAYESAEVAIEEGFMDNKGRADVEATLKSAPVLTSTSRVELVGKNLTITSREAIERAEAAHPTGDEEHGNSEESVPDDTKVPRAERRRLEKEKKKAGKKVAKT